MSANVERYRALVADWMRAREQAPGGELSQDAEADWVDKVDDVWRAMTEAERCEVDPDWGKA